MIRGHDLQNVTCKPNAITTLYVSAVIGRFISFDYSSLITINNSC